jgi:hypothetical protein
MLETTRIIHEDVTSPQAKAEYGKADYTAAIEISGITAC